MNHDGWQHSPVESGQIGHTLDRAQQQGRRVMSERGVRGARGGLLRQCAGIEAASGKRVNRWADQFAARWVGGGFAECAGLNSLRGKR